jgi:hypothetical protein
MKLALFLPLLWCILPGCTTVAYRDAQGRQFDLARLMADAAVDSVEIRPDGTVVIRGYRSESQQVVEAAVRGAVDAAIKGAKP